MSSQSTAGRQLLPKSPGSGAGAASRSEPSSSQPLIKRSTTRIACNGCRQKRRKCDGLKPTCSWCASNRFVCTYRGHDAPDQVRLVKRKNPSDNGSSQNVRQFLEHLRTSTSNVADAALQNMRSKGSVDEIIRSIDSNALPDGSFSAPKIPRQISDPVNGPASHNLAPHLYKTYPNAYLEIKSLDFATIDLGLIGFDSWPDYHKIASKMGRSSSYHSNIERQKHATHQNLNKKTLISSHKAIDEKLRHLNIGQWTSISTTSSLAAQAISFYLVNEHPVLGLFDPDLFMRDLIRGGGPFCSHLLVSSLLAWSFGTYTQFDHGAKHLSYEFLHEAIDRWGQEVQRDTLTTASAAIFLTIACNHHGKDKDGLQYLDAAAEIGRRLGLFDAEPFTYNHLWVEESDTRDAACFTAWGVFGWLTLHMIYFRREHQIQYPPELPIPGDNIECAYGRGPDLPDYMGKSFTYISKLWLLVHKTNRAGLFQSSEPSFPTSKFLCQEFLAWSQNLPEAARRGDSCPHHVLIMHSWYHTSIMDIWRRYVSRRRKLDPQSLEDRFPEIFYHGSIQQLARILYQYRERFESTRRTILISPGFLYLLNEVFRTEKSPQAQFQFLISIHGYLALASWSPFMCGAVKALFLKGVQIGLIQSPGAEALMEKIQNATGTLAEDTEYSSRYPIDLSLSYENSESGNLETMVKGFQQMTVSGGSKKVKSDRLGITRLQGNLKNWDPTLSEALDPKSLSFSDI